MSPLYFTQEIKRLKKFKNYLKTHEQKLSELIGLALPTKSGLPTILLFRFLICKGKKLEGILHII